MWVDPVCIDQNNADEKGQQVQLMGQIFGNAQRVLLWVGPATATDPKAFELIRAFEEGLLNGLTSHVAFGRTEDPIAALKKSEEWAAVARFFRRTWFMRVWMVQECALAKEAIVCCGTLTMGFHMLANATANFRRAGLHETFDGQTAIAVQGSPPRATETVEIMMRLRGDTGPTGLLRLLRMTRQLRATDLRDKIFALTSMIKGKSCCSSPTTL